jgi:hypothetical protein
MPAFAAGVSAEGSPEAAGTVVPLIELPEGALPVKAAWLSGVGGGEEAVAGKGGPPASVLSKPGLGLLSSVRGPRAALLESGASGADASGAVGALGSSAISCDYTLTLTHVPAINPEREHTYSLVS